LETKGVQTAAKFKTPTRNYYCYYHHYHRHRHLYAGCLQLYTVPETNHVSRVYTV